MYLVAFYSFKGGVGRTLALVNIAFELAQKGKRVLMVDFDLEAPGLDTFDLSPASGRTPGIVEYVSKYIAEGRPPKVDDFLYEVEDGKLWTMPSGIRDEGYERRLREIDWQQIYAERDGYLMIEELKAQWKQFVNPDYVLIDSRTGHTDVAGICTRQLPDAVVLLFLPNTQNLRGLKKIVADIRDEAKPNRNKVIQTYFVMSNVPALDDENSILVRKQDEFKRELGFRELSQTIHYYESLSLLDQEIFTRVRPNTRLAKEYQILAELIVRNNPEDREGAIRYLKSLGQQGLRVDEEDEKLNRIAVAFPNDGEILMWRAEVRMKRSNFAEAIPLLDDAIARGLETPSVYLKRATSRITMGDRSGANEDIVRALQIGSMTESDVMQALRSLSDSESNYSEIVAKVASSAALLSLSPRSKAGMSELLLRSRAGFTAALDLLMPAVSDPSIDKENQKIVISQCALVMIGLGRFETATRMLSRVEPLGIENTRSIRDAFNYAMATWGLTRSVPKELFRNVVSLHEQSPPPATANYPQCISLAYWATGELRGARVQLELAKSRVAAILAAEFSCWRYMLISPKEFLKDVDSIERLFAGEALEPAFVTRWQEEREGDQ